MFQLKENTVGISNQRVGPTESARQVLWKIQDFNMESLPVEDENDKWLFFANRGEILANLMTTLMLEEKLEEN